MLRAAQTAWKTDTGRQRRDNEDSAFARPPVFVVADGMGGAQAGEVASRIAVETFQREFPPQGSPLQRLVACAREANRQIHEISRTEHERAGMGTTLTAVYVSDADLAVAHVGDSRAYLLRDGQLIRLTRDHSLVEELLRQGKLTEEQAAEHPQRSIITRALGIDAEVSVDTDTYPARAGDVVLLCSDGLTSMISEAQVAATLNAEPDLDRAGERLIAEANQAGGRDNITVILFRLEEAGGAAPAEPPTVVGLERADAQPPAEEGAGPPGPATSRSPSAIMTAPSRTRAPARPEPLRPGVARVSAPRPRTAGPVRRRGPRRWAGALAALLATAIVLFLVGGGGYLASRQLFFVATNPQGLLTIYRGLPYDLPLGVRLYEQVYVSGAPATLVPAARRSQLLNHQLRSQADAIGLIHAAELGQLVR